MSQRTPANQSSRQYRRAPCRRGPSCVRAPLCRALRRFVQQVLLPGRRDRRRRELDEDVRARDPRLDPGVHVDLVRQPVALAAVARRARSDDVVPPRRAALGARDHVVDGQRGARAAVLARPAVAGEHGTARDLPLVRVARDLHVGDQSDDHGLGERAVGPVQRLAADLDHLGLLLQEQDRGAPHGAHVDGLIRRVEHQHTTTRPTADAVGTRSVPRVVSGRHRPQWAARYGCRHDLAESSYGGDGNEASTRTPSAWERSAPIAWATAGSSSRPAASTKNMYVPSPSRRGRDSMRVRLTPRSANSARQRTSQPGASSAGSQNTSAVFPRPPAAAGGASRATHTKRVSLPGGSSTPSSSTSQPYSPAAPLLPIAAHGVSSATGRSATTRTASAVEAAGTTVARGRRVRRKPAHWPLACGCEATAAMRSSGRAARAIRQWWMGCTSSPAIWTPPSSAASASSVALTAPSREFSIGTSARSTRPSRTAATASWTLGSGTGPHPPPPPPPP